VESSESSSLPSLFSLPDVLPGGGIGFVVAAGTRCYEVEVSFERDVQIIVWPEPDMSTQSAAALDFAIRMIDSRPVAVHQLMVRSRSIAGRPITLGKVSRCVIADDVITLGVRVGDVESRVIVEHDLQFECESAAGPPERWFLFDVAFAHILEDFGRSPERWSAFELAMGEGWPPTAD
jgi:hypothetical protein